MNKRVLLASLQGLGRASRADLAKATKLSQPTVGKIVDNLIGQGIIEEFRAPLESAASGPSRLIRNRAGRPGRTLRLNNTRPRFIGIHLDVRETRFSLMPVHPQPRDRWDRIVPTPSNLQAWRRLVKQTKAELMPGELLGIILCVPGIVDEAAGNVLFSPNLHWTENVSLPASLHDVWQIPVVVVQELRSLALGHKTFDTSGEDFLTVDIGEGVGAAAVVGGRPYATQLPMSGELGHTQVHGSNRTCGCGAVGCLETLIGRCGLLKSFSDASGLGEVDLDALNVHIAAQGVPPWLSDTLYGAGKVIAGALNVMGIRRVIITGLINDLPECVHALLSEAISSGSIWQRFGKITCVFAPRHHTAGMVAVGLDRVVMPSDPGVPLAHLPRATQKMTG